MNKDPMWLVGAEGKARRVRLPINTPLLIGRGASNHIVLDDPRISRQHARLAPEEDGTFLYDLNSANGTMVNGTMVTRHRLQLDDVIRFGRYVFRIEEGTESAAPAELEKATLIATESVARMLISRERDSKAGSAERPMVDLTQLQDAHQKLGTLYAFMKSISSTFDKDELLRLIGARIREVYPRARSVAILSKEPHLPDEEGFQLVHFAGADIVSNDVKILPPHIVVAIIETHQAMLHCNTLPDSTRYPAGSDMFAPMIDRGEVLGIIHVTAADAIFSSADLELLNGMAATSAMMIQNSRMQEERIARDRLRYDLELAAKIQKSFLPREVISVEGLELFAEYRAAYTIGGDFYDVFWVGPDQLAIFIGDISGKGVAAALLMARVSSELRVAALAHVEPSAVLSAMNDAIIASDQPELFFTAIYLTFDVKTGQVTLANAGHPSPYVCRPGSRGEPIVAGASTAIGIFESPTFEATTFQLNHGESLVLYTDGVLEAADSAGRLYGVERLEACLEAGVTRPKDIVDRILTSVEEHALNASASDDLTLFICHRSPGKAMSLQPQRRSGELPAQLAPVRR